jgi:hypothetical protein
MNAPARKSQLHCVHDYSAAISSAVAWLGDRYLLAKPINATPARRVHRVPDISLVAARQLDHREALAAGRAGFGVDASTRQGTPETLGNVLPL